MFKKIKKQEKSLLKNQVEYKDDQVNLKDLVQNESVSMKKLFGNLKMGYKEVLIFSFCVGLFCGVFGGMPILKDSSFTDMAGGYEWWTLWAVIICVNSKNYKDAGLKCGLFFLITQPLQFFIQAFLYSHNYLNALYYTRVWLPVIIGTFFGGMVAYHAKKDNMIGAIVLGLGNTIEGMMFIHYLYSFINNPPKHLIATLISIISIILMTKYLQKGQRRIIALIIPLILCGIVLIYALINGLTI